MNFETGHEMSRSISHYTQYTTRWTTGVQFLAGAMMGFIFSMPPRPDQLWDPHSLLFKGYRGLLPRGLSGPGVMLTTLLHLLRGQGMGGAIPPLLQYVFMA
jgi:hypothetical protein